MNSYLLQSLVWDHIMESRQQAAAARTARSARCRAGALAARAGHRMAGGA